MVRSSAVLISTGMSDVVAGCCWLPRKRHIGYMYLLPGTSMLTGPEPDISFRQTG